MFGSMREQFLIKSMSPPRTRRSSQTVAKDGHAAPGKCGSCPTPKFIWNRCCGICFRKQRRWDLPSKPASPWWTSTHGCWRTGWSFNRCQIGTSETPFSWEIQDSRTYYESSREGAPKALKKECNPQTRLGGEMWKSTEAKTCRGKWSAEE